MSYKLTQIFNINFIKLFYVFLVGLLALKFLPVISHIYPEIFFYTWPIKLIYICGLPIRETLLFMLLSLIAVLLYLLIYNKLSKLRFAIPVLFIFCVAGYYISTTDLYHCYHSTIYVCIFLPFIRFQWDSRDRFIIYLIQISVLMTYLLAGLWKLRSFISYLQLNGYNEHFVNWISYSIADKSLALGVQPSAIGKALMFSNDGIKLLMMFLTLAFEIGAIIPIFYPRFISFWGFSILVFHILCYFFLGILFFPAPITAFIFLVLAEKQIKQGPYGSISSQPSAV